jgi:hypothetical protein
VGCLCELADLVPFHSRDVDDQRYDQAEGVAVRADAHLRGHRGVAERGVLAARDQAQRAVEAGGVARREELLRVGPGAGPAEFGREGQVQVDPPVGRDDVAVAPVAGGGRLGGVQNLIWHTATLS